RRDHDRGDGGVVLEAVEDGEEVFHEGRVERVELVVGPVDHDRGDSVGDFEAEVLEGVGLGHVSAPGGLWPPARRRRTGGGGRYLHHDGPVRWPSSATGGRRWRRKDGRG